MPQPYLGVAAWAVCAETDAEAERLASSFKMLMTLMQRGQLIPVPPPEKAIKFLDEDVLGARGLPMRSRRLIVGTRPVVRAGIEGPSHEYRADEVLLVNILYPQPRRPTPIVRVGRRGIRSARSIPPRTKR